MWAVIGLAPDTVWLTLYELYSGNRDLRAWALIGVYVCQGRIQRLFSSTGCSESKSLPGARVELREVKIPLPTLGA